MEPVAVERVVEVVIDVEVCEDGKNGRREGDESGKLIKGAGLPVEPAAVVIEVAVKVEADIFDGGGGGVLLA